MADVPFHSRPAPDGNSRPREVTAESCASTRPSLQARIYALMHVADPGGLNVFQRALVLSILASVAVAVLFSEPVVRSTVGSGLVVLETFFGALFVLEYIVRVWSAGSQADYSRWRGRLHYMRQPLTIIDLIAVVPFVTGVLGAETMVLRLIRLLRLLALSKLLRYSKAVHLVMESVMSRRFELGFTALLGALVILVSSAALYVVEGGHQPEAFGSIPRAAWWSVATLTTVGYGDIVPVTPIGRFFAAVTAFAGIGLIAMPTGILAAAFSDAFAKARAKEAVGKDGMS